MDDKELLELAAKAAGINGKWGKENYVDGRDGFIPKGWSRRWEPREQDDVAFSLMMNLPISKIQSILIMAEGYKNDARINYIRHAIVRAAAEIGKEL